MVSTAASSESAPGGTDLFTFDSLIAALDDMGEEEAFDVFVEPLIDEYSRAILDAQDGLACDTTMYAFCRVLRFMYRAHILLLIGICGSHPYLECRLEESWMTLQVERTHRTPLQTSSPED